MICWRLDHILALKIPCNIMIAVECEVYKKYPWKVGFWHGQYPFSLNHPPQKKKIKKIEFFCVQRNYYSMLYMYSGNVIIHCIVCNYLVTHSSLGVLLFVVGCNIPQVITWVRWYCYAVASDAIWTNGNHLPLWYPLYHIPSL